MSRVNRATSKAYRPALESITRHEINWTIVARATPAWAAAVFPDLPQRRSAWQALARDFRCVARGSSDPVAAWKEHDANLHARADRLNEKRYSALHFRGPGTDLRVGLADGHLWLGGGTTARQWALLHSQYAHRRSLHHAAQGSRGRARDQHQAALAIRAP